MHGLAFVTRMHMFCGWKILLFVGFGANNAWAIGHHHSFVAAARKLIPAVQSKKEVNSTLLCADSAVASVLVFAIKFTANAWSFACSCYLETRCSRNSKSLDHAKFEFHNVYNKHSTESSSGLGTKIFTVCWILLNLVAVPNINIYHVRKLFQALHFLYLLNAHSTL